MAGNVVNLRGKKLFPGQENKLALTIETADNAPIYGHAAWMICALCKSNGKVYLNNDPAKIVLCVHCNGFGYLIRFLRADQLEAPSPLPPGPKPTFGS
jgi:hypothetical protein